MAFDFWILDFIQAYLRSPFMDMIMPVVTRLGDHGVFWIAAAIALLLIPRTRRVGALVALALIIEFVCCDIVLKPLVARIRPFAVSTDISLLIAPPVDFSFPSGHTGASFASASAMYFGRKYFGKNYLWISAAVIAALIAFSRLYLYVHYPTDVLAGLCLGIASGWLASLIVGRFTSKGEA